jgi:Holliday junction resolvase RusA-like endonuclease
VLTVVVHDTPRPQGSKKSFGRAGKDGKVRTWVVNDNDEELKTWREAVKEAAENARKALSWQELAFPMDGPVALRMTFSMYKPKSRPKYKRSWPTVKPDLHKIVRSTEDALKAAGVLRDDAQIIEEHLRKDYVMPTMQLDNRPLGWDVMEVPGVVIRIWPVTEEYDREPSGNQVP